MIFSSVQAEIERMQKTAEMLFVKYFILTSQF